MEIKRILAVFFSPTGTTRKLVTGIAEEIALHFEKEGIYPEHCHYDFTTPRGRSKGLVFSPEDLVVFGVPVYAGRVPNVLLKFLDTVEGNGAMSIPIVVYGNRNYDDALIELGNLLEKKELRPIGAAAFVGQHSFSEILASGRPDESDMSKAQEFAAKAAQKCKEILAGKPIKAVQVKGEPFPYRGYYQPRDRAATPVDFRKIKPVTNQNCTKCGACVQFCSMGSINPANPAEVTGICIKCCACLKKCPKKAKLFDDKAFVYHKVELEEEYTGRTEPEWFL